MITNAATINNNLTDLRREMKILRSFIIGLAGKDKDGAYKQEFVKKIFKASEEVNVGEFTNREDFLKRIA